MLFFCRKLVVELILRKIEITCSRNKKNENRRKIRYRIYFVSLHSHTSQSELLANFCNLRDNSFSSEIALCALAKLPRFFFIDGGWRCCEIRWKDVYIENIYVDEEDKQALSEMHVDNPPPTFPSLVKSTKLKNKMNLMALQIKRHKFSGFFMSLSPKSRNKLFVVKNVFYFSSVLHRQQLCSPRVCAFNSYFLIALFFSMEWK